MEVVVPPLKRVPNRLDWLEQIRFVESHPTEALRLWAEQSGAPQPALKVEKIIIKYRKVVCYCLPTGKSVHRNGVWVGFQVDQRWYRGRCVGRDELSVRLASARAVSDFFRVQKIHLASLPQ